jgi:hypothetical protein
MEITRVCLTFRIKYIKAKNEKYGKQFGREKKLMYKGVKRSKKEKKFYKRTI